MLLCALGLQRHASLGSPKPRWIGAIESPQRPTDGFANEEFIAEVDFLRWYPSAVADR